MRQALTSNHTRFQRFHISLKFIFLPFLKKYFLSFLVRSKHKVKIIQNTPNTKDAHEPEQDAPI